MTTGPALAPLVLIAAALVSFPETPVMPGAKPGRAVRTSPTIRQRRAAVVAGGLIAVAVLLGWPWWFGLAAGSGAGAATFRLPVRRSAAQRTEERRELAVRADLLAACLDAGMSVGGALLAVRTEVVPVRTGRPEHGGDDGPLQLLDGVAAMLTLGADPDVAWRSAQQHPDLAALAAAARRSAAGGTGLADAVREHAVALRAADADAAARSAGRAGVAMTAPLGLCFLPAFLCLGLAPVVVGLLSSLHLS